MLILLLLYLASQGWAKDVPHDTNYILRPIFSCPASGYFFSKEPSVNSIGTCYLCFCQGNNTAVCWKRENKKCDVQHYRHNSTIVKKEKRVRRSPFGLGDIFFQDAAREVFNRKEPEACKPYESSFSEGCPPADWCIGCTVCDCNANGHWECHILSFCDDDKGKKKKQHKKGNNKVALRYPEPRQISTKTMKSVTKLPPKVRNTAKMTKTTTTIKPAVKKAQKGPTKVTRPRSVIQNGKPAKPLIIKKNDNNRKVVKSSTSKKVMNGSEAEMSEVIMKTMMTVMAKMWNKQVTEAIPNIVNIIQKRSFPVTFNQTKARAKPVRYKPVTHKPKPKQKIEKEHVYNKSLFMRKQKNEERRKSKEMQKKKELEDKKRQQEKRAANTRKKSNNSIKKPVYKNNKSDKTRTKRQTVLNNDTYFTVYTDSDANENVTNTQPTSKQFINMKQSVNNPKEQSQNLYEENVDVDNLAVINLNLNSTDLTATDNILHATTHSNDSNAVINIDLFSQNNVTVTDYILYAKNSGDDNRLEMNKTMYSTNNADDNLTVTDNVLYATNSANKNLKVKDNLYSKNSADNKLSVTNMNLKSESYINNDLTVTNNNLNLTNSIDNKLTKTVDNSNSINPVKNNVTVTNNSYSTKNYYEYSLNFTTEIPANKTQINYYQTTVYVNNETSINEKHFNKNEKFKLNLQDEIPNEVVNDIKLTKWSAIKIFQNKEREVELNLNKTAVLENTFNKVIGNTTTIPNEHHKKIVNPKDIKRKMDKTTRKYSLTRMVNTNNCKKRRGNDINIENVHSTSLSSKIDNLRNVLKRLLSEFHKNNTLSHEHKRKKTNAIKYLKKFFNNIFYQDSNKTIISKRLRNNNHTIEMLCESFGPCIINKKNKIVLMKKLKELNNETVQILKSLRIIKGLLRLVDIPHSFTTSPSNKTSFRTDIHKLNIILKKSPEDEDMKILPETQRIQMKYIKSNTKEFTRNVAKFTKILNQIIELISVKDDKEKQRRWYSEARLNNSKVNSTELETVKKFKQLLRSYNIIHNAFIKKIIEMFTTVQDKKDVDRITARRTRTKYDSENILNNLNKLKNLDSVLNQGRRRKRHVVRQDNAVEYLLMMMEYMFQKNYQLDTAPVNDGIDLLIEAIKNAPDIKTIKKKVLKHIASSEMRAAESSQNMSKEDSASDTNTLAEDSIFSNKIDNSSITDQNSEDDRDTEIQLFQLGNDNADTENSKQGKKSGNEERKKEVDTSPSINNEITENSHTIYSKSTRSEIYQKDNDYETSTKVYVGEDAVLADFDSRLEKTSGEFDKKNRVYNAELDDDNNIEETSVSKTTFPKDEELREMPKISPNTVTSEAITTLKSITKAGKYNDSDEFSSSNEKENNDLDQVSNNTLDEIIPITTSRTINPTTKPINKPLKDINIDLSDLSKEYSDEKTKIKVKKAEEVLIKKEQDLMNSLDYGTESTIVEDHETKEDDDKFLNDYFAD